MKSPLHKPDSSRATRPRTTLLDQFVAHENRPLSFGDTYSSKLRGDDITNIDDLFERFFDRTPKWIKALLTIRNQIVGRLGFETGSTSPGELPKHPIPGDSIGVFEVLGRSEDELFLGNDDRHITFRVSLTLQENSIGASTVAYANSRVGRLYLRCIRPFHQQVVKRMVNNATR